MIFSKKVNCSTNVKMQFQIINKDLKYFIIIELEKNNEFII